MAFVFFDKPDNTIIDNIDKPDKPDKPIIDNIDMLSLIPLEIWFYIFEYISDSDVAALNGLNRYYRQFFDCGLLYKQRFQKQFKNLVENDDCVCLNRDDCDKCDKLIIDKIESRKIYFDYWEKIHKFKINTGMINMTKGRLYYIYNWDKIPNINNWHFVFYRIPDNWECKYEIESISDSYLMHDIDSEGRCNYCKPYNKTIKRRM